MSARNTITGLVPCEVAVRSAAANLSLSNAAGFTGRVPLQRGGASCHPQYGGQPSSTPAYPGFRAAFAACHEPLPGRMEELFERLQTLEGKVEH